MKVAIVIRSLASIGGLEKITVLLANQLSHIYEVDLISFSENKGYYQLDPKLNVIEKKIQYNFIEKVFKKICKRVFRTNRFSHYKEVAFLDDILKMHNYDVIIASDGDQCMSVSDVIKHQNKPIKFISWMHNDYEVYFNKYFKQYKDKLADSLSRSSYVVTLTNKNKDEYGIHNKNTIRIYNPLTLELPKLSTLKNKEIIFVSRLVKEQKGLDFLIDIATKIKHTDWKIRIVGEGKDSNWLKSSVEENNLQETVILHGSVTNQLQNLYADASLFISTSRWEGFGLVITEAMACGLPVVAFENSGPNEILNGGDYGILIPQYDTDVFAKTLLELMDNPNTLALYSQKSVERSTDFSIEKIIEQWKNIIEN